MNDKPHDLPTVLAIGALVYASASVLHEAAGHGGACVLVDGAPRALSSMHFTCDLAGQAPWARRAMAAGGTTAQLALGTMAYSASRMLERRAPASGPMPWRYALWLFATVNLLQGFGYFLFSGVGGAGDWAVVTGGLPRPAVWRAALALGGFALYWAATARLFRMLVPFLGTTVPEQLAHARRLALAPYVAGGALALAAGALNPGGLGLLAISGVAATFGGTSGLVWGAQTLRGGRTRVARALAPATVPRSWPAIALGLLVSIAFVVVLGPGLRF